MASKSGLIFRMSFFLMYYFKNLTRTILVKQTSNSHMIQEHPKHFFNKSNRSRQEYTHSIIWIYLVDIRGLERFSEQKKDVPKIPSDPSSVTRFGKISPFWQNIGQFFEVLFTNWKNLGPPLADFLCHLARFL